MPADLDMNQPQAKQPWGAWSTLGFSILILGLMIGVSTAVFVIILVQMMFTTPDLDIQAVVPSLATDGTVLAITTLIANAIGVGLIYGCVRLKRQLSFKAYLDFHPVAVKTYAIWIGLLALFLGFSEALSRSLNHSETFMEELLKSTSQPILLFLAVVVAAPIFEELLFRGFMLPGLRRSPLGVPGAILLTSGIWAVIHFQYDWFSMGIIFVMGVLLGYAHIKTRSIYIPIALHGVNNGLAFILTALTIQ